MTSNHHYKVEDKVMVAVDCIIFGFDKEGLKILLIKRGFEPEKGKWSLLGGFLKKEENLDNAANRVLKKLTGLENIYLEQLSAYSKIDRDPVERTISISYFALINKEEHDFELTKEYHAQWFTLDNYPRPIFDHPKMIKKALARLRRKAVTYPLGFELLPEKFTMRQLQNLYECILDQKLDKRNFINKVNSLNVLVKLDEKDKSTSKKGAFLYKFDEKKYKLKTKENFNLK